LHSLPEAQDEQLARKELKSVCHITAREVPQGKKARSRNLGIPWSFRLKKKMVRCYGLSTGLRQSESTLISPVSKKNTKY